MSLDGASGLYMLNLSVDKVVLVKEAAEKRKFVCLQAFFWGLPMINIHQAIPTNENSEAAEQNVFTNFELGTTGYFHSATIDLIRSIQRHPILLTIFQILEGSDNLEPVGTCKVKVTEKFSELISRAATCAVKHAVSGVVKGIYNIMNKEHILVGTLTVHIQLICYDNSLLKTPYVPPSDQNNALDGTSQSKYLLPRKTSYGFALVPAEEEGPSSFTESFPNGKGVFNKPEEDQRNTLLTKTLFSGPAALSPIDIACLVCNTTISESYFNADQSNDSFVSKRKGSQNESTNETTSYTVEQPRAKPEADACIEGASPNDEDSTSRKMTIVTYRSDSGTDNTKRRTMPCAGEKVEDSATQKHSAQDQSKQLRPLKIYCKDGSVEGSRQSSVIASPALECCQNTIGFKYHSCEEKDLTKASTSEKTPDQDGLLNPGDDFRSEKGEFRRKSTSDYVMMAFAPRTALKKGSCDPLNYEYSKASQRICEKYLKRRQAEKANNTTSPKSSEKQPSQHQVSEMSLELMGTKGSPISSVYNCPCPTDEVNQTENSAAKHLHNSAQQSNSADKASGKHHQVEQTLGPSLNQPPHEICHEAETRLPRHPCAEETASNAPLKEQSFTRQKCVQEDAFDALESRCPQPEITASKVSTKYQQSSSEILPEGKPGEWQRLQYPQAEGMNSNRPSPHQSPFFQSRDIVDTTQTICSSDKATENRRSPYQQSEQRSPNRPSLYHQSHVSGQAAEKLRSQCSYAKQTDSPPHVFFSEDQNVDRHALQHPKPVKVVSKSSSGHREGTDNEETQPSQYPCPGKTTPDTYSQYQSQREISQNQALKLDHSQYPHPENTSPQIPAHPKYQPSSKVYSEEKTAEIRSYAGTTSSKVPSPVCQHQIVVNIECAPQNTETASVKRFAYSTPDRSTLEYRPLDHQYGVGLDERQSVHPYCEEVAEKEQKILPQFQNGSCVDSKDNVHAAAEKLPSPYGNQSDQLHPQCQPETTDQKYPECDSILHEAGHVDGKPQGTRISVSLECTLGTENSVRRPELTAQNPYGGTESQGEVQESSRYHPVCSEKTSDRQIAYSHLCCPSRSSEKEECQRENVKIMEPKTQLPTHQHQCGGFQPYQKDSCSTYQSALRSRGRADLRHLYSRKNIQNAMKQSEYSQYKAPVCQPSTEKVEGNFGDYGNVDNATAKPAHATYLSVETAKEQQQSGSGFSQYQTSGKRFYADATVGKAKRPDSVDRATDNNKLENVKVDNNQGWNDCSDKDALSSHHKTSRRKSKQRQHQQELFRGVSGHTSNPRENGRYNPETPSVHVTPILSSGSLKGCYQPFQWYGMHTVAQNTDNVSPDNCGTPGWAVHRGSSATEPQPGHKSPYSARPTTTPGCNAPSFSRTRGVTQNTGYSHCGGHACYHDYRNMNLSRYSSYGGQTFLNACGVDGCVNSRCVWSNCHPF